MINYRAYQRDIIEYALRAVKDKTPKMVCKMPYGSGRSVVMAGLADSLCQEGLKVCVLSPKQEMLMSIKSFLDELGYSVKSGRLRRNTVDGEIALTTFRDILPGATSANITVFICDGIAFGGTKLSELHRKSSACFVGFTASDSIDKGFFAGIEPYYVADIEVLQEESYGFEYDYQEDDFPEGRSTGTKDEYPFDASRIRIDGKNFSVYQVYTWINCGRLILRPEYQRNFVWDEKKQSLLIESLMLRIPIPAFYFDETDDAKMTVIDGMQRLTTIKSFMDGEFCLEGLEYLTDNEGKYFSELSGKYKARIEDTQLSINVLDASCPRLLKINVFRRLNTGGVSLNSQEVRNIMAAPAVRGLLISMASSRSFIEATHGMIKDKRMVAQELCLRYLAFMDAYSIREMKFKPYKDLTTLLDQEVLDLNELNEADLNRRLQVFEQSMQKCHALFGERAFIKTEGTTRINRALFTSYSVLLSYCDVRTNQLNRMRGRCKSILEEKLREGSEYYRSITSSTGSKKNLAMQFKTARDVLEEIGCLKVLD